MRVVVRGVSNVIRAFPDILWALLFVAAVGIGALSGLLALFFFSIAVVTKLTADTLDGIDIGPLEAANASGARHSQMLRTAVVPQILPAYASYALYAFELNLRASSVIGFVGAGGIGQRIAVLRVAEQLGSGVGHRRDVRHRRVRRRPHLDAVAQAAGVTAELQSPPGSRRRADDWDEASGPAVRDVRSGRRSASGRCSSSGRSGDSTSSGAGCSRRRRTCTACSS